MKVHVVNLVEKGLKRIEKKIYEAKIAIMGLAYKKNIDDTRESPSIKIIEQLVNLGAAVRDYDPYVKSIETKCGRFYSEKTIEDALDGIDCAVFVTDHEEFKNIDNAIIKELIKGRAIIDCKNIFNDNQIGDFIYYGLGALWHDSKKST